ncbi:MAG: hypothetical protein Q4C41_03490 [Eggerthellaceae bacterium]|nr:hypothetical protein [Eggerthellaceae bacterium]
MPEIKDMTDDELRAEIAACKIILANNDYKQMKYLRGDMPEDEWQEVLALIHSKIDTINACEAELEARTSTAE